MADEAQTRMPGGGGASSLAARYRPQTFAQVVGQDMVKSILSRAAREDRVAPAYLLSGTRGVGKTTVARIFAKALNCAHAPTGEPCNECSACRRITQGSFVDVVEIDGASNRGIDDVRRLRDAVGYAPLEGRYKVFIIDEAHMLTKEAFNALLKTLEEPPARVTFIMATTEQHKFPVTIISRCQHFVFRQIPEATLEAHICSVLEREGRPFEEDAARLIARRAAGSVRDAMSLLGQTLALGGGSSGELLTAAQAREVLGLAGREVMDRLMDALARQDALGVARLVRELLAQGADMGFFLRELGALWRNLFLLRQAGPEAAAVLELPQRETERLTALAEIFPLSYIHAAWQMTLESQRRILTSLEPAAGLELLLLNLALLPRLLPLGELNPAISAGSGGSTLPPAETSKVGETSGATERGRPFADGAASPAGSESAPVGASSHADSEKKANSEKAEASRRFRPPEHVRRTAAYAPLQEESSVSPQHAAGDEVPPWLDQIPAEGDSSLSGPEKTGQERDDEQPLSEQKQVAIRQDAPAVASGEQKKDGPLLWEDFLAFCEGREGIPLNILRQCSGDIQGTRLYLTPYSQTVFRQLRRYTDSVGKAAGIWAGQTLELDIQPPRTERRTSAELKAEMQEHPVVREFGRIYGATLVHCAPEGEE